MSTFAVVLLFTASCGSTSLRRSQHPRSVPTPSFYIGEQAAGAVLLPVTKGEGSGHAGVIVSPTAEVIVSLWCVGPSPISVAVASDPSVPFAPCAATQLFGTNFSVPINVPVSVVVQAHGSTHWELIVTQAVAQSPSG